MRTDFWAGSGTLRCKNIRFFSPHFLRSATQVSTTRKNIQQDFNPIENTFPSRSLITNMNVVFKILFFSRVIWKFKFRRHLGENASMATDFLGVRSVRRDSFLVAQRHDSGHEIATVSSPRLSLSCNYLDTYNNRPLNGDNFFFVSAHNF